MSHAPQVSRSVTVRRISLKRSARDCTQRPPVAGPAPSATPSACAGDTQRALDRAACARASLNSSDGCRALWHRTLGGAGSGGNAGVRARVTRYGVARTNARLASAAAMASGARWPRRSSWLYGMQREQGSSSDLRLPVDMQTQVHQHIARHECKPRRHDYQASTIILPGVIGRVSHVGGKALLQMNYKACNCIVQERFRADRVA